MALNEKPNQREKKAKQGHRFFSINLVGPIPPILYLHSLSLQT